MPLTTAEAAIGGLALAWTSVVAFVFGTIETHWLVSGHAGLTAVALGILGADAASAVLYWQGWTLRRFVWSAVIAIIVTIAGGVVASASGLALLAPAGILAAPLLVHSATVCCWAATRTLSGSGSAAPALIGPLRLALLLALAAIVSAAVTRLRVAELFASTRSAIGPDPLVLVGAGTVGGTAFWLLFAVLADRIPAKGNEQLRHVLEELIGARAGPPRIEPPSANGGRMSVFVAYVRENLEDVRRICDYLEAEGLAVVWDQKLRPGEVWKEVLDDGIRAAGKVLICCSAESEARQESEFYAEIRSMIDRARTKRPGTAYLIPLRLSDCRIPDIRLDATTTLNSIQSVDLFPESRWHAGMQAIVDAVARG